MAVINIVDGQTNEILDDITAKFILSNSHRKSLKDNLETFDFRTFADKYFSEHLGKHNRVIIPAEDNGFIEFVVWEASKYRDTEGLKAEVYTTASYLLLKKAAIIKPQKLEEQTASMIAGHALSEVDEWQVGIVEGKGTRTFHIEEHTNPYAFLRRIAKEFNLELNFRVETDGNRIIGRYVDLLEQVGEWRGREVEFGKDLIGIRRTEKAGDIYTALLGLGPEREDGPRLEVFIEDQDALQRWGRPDKHNQLQHLVDVYEPESSDQNMSRERLTTLIELELAKRVNAVVEYETTIADLEHVPGMENKKIRFGDTIKIKDLKFNPPLYIEARVHTQDRDIIDKSNKHVELGDFIEYTEEEVKAIWQTMQEELRKKLDKLVLASIVSSAGNVFKNGIGKTELEVKTFLGGTEVDEDGSRYGYHWFKYDKDGELVTDFSESKKKITVAADSIDEKASYTVHIAVGTEILTMAQVTISNVFDGEDGGNGDPGKPGIDGESTYMWKKYADNETGLNMSDDPDDKRYLGIASNKSTPDASSNPADYTWSPLYDNVSASGRNYILHELLMSIHSVVTYGDDLKGRWYQFAAGAGNLTKVGVFEENTEYTFSYELENQASTNTRFVIEYTDGTNIQLSDNQPFTTPKSKTVSRVRITYSSSNGLMRLYNPTFTKSNIEIDWTPAPEDFDQAVEDVNTRVTTTEASVTELDDAVKLKASQTDLNLVTDRVTHAETEMNLLPGKFDLTVQKNGIIGAINATPELLLIDFAKMKVKGEIEAEHIKSLAGLNINDQLVVDANGVLTLGNDRVRIDENGMQITRPDGAIAMTNGITNNEYSVSSYDPHYMRMGESTAGGHNSFRAFDSSYGSWYAATKGILDGRGTTGSSGIVYKDVRDSMSSVVFQRYEFIHSARYLVFSYWNDRVSGKHSLHVLNGGSANVDDRIFFRVVEADHSGTIDCIIDLGKPTYRSRDVSFKIGWTHGWGSGDDPFRFRMLRVIQTDVL